MDKVKILWSGITGKTGSEALKASKSSSLAQIVGGISRNNREYYNYTELDNITIDFDIIVDFSHKDSFDQVLNFALKKKKPLISGTSGITDEQLERLNKSSNIISIFRGGNFRFEVETFINDVVELAKKSKETFKIVETHYKTKEVPSETAKTIEERVLEETGKILEIESHLEYDDLINDWRFGPLHCRVEGFEQLGKDVLEIAYIMKDKKPDGLYDLRKIINDKIESK